MWGSKSIKYSRYALVVSKPLLRIRRCSFCSLCTPDILISVQDINLFITLNLVVGFVWFDSCSKPHQQLRVTSAHCCLSTCSDKLTRCSFPFLHRTSKGNRSTTKTHCGFAKHIALPGLLFT